MAGAVYFDGPIASYTGEEVDIALTFALSTGYPTTARALGVDVAVDGKLEALYAHGIKWGKIDRITDGGKRYAWILPTEGRWPTVAESRALYATSPPDTSWMTSPPDLSHYLLNSDPVDGLSPVGSRVE